MIQGNLVAFSNFLQAQEALKLKNKQQALDEQTRIDAVELEIKKAEAKQKKLTQKQADIEMTVKKMQVYETFLKEVIAENPDEFDEPLKITKRYQTLSSNQKTLRDSVLRDQHLLDEKTK